jgi:hypothetical protein
MLRSLQYWVLSAIGAACVLLVVANIAIASKNQDLQLQVSQRGQYIQQTVQLQALYQQIVHALADLSVRNKDGQLSAILATQGIHVTVNTPAGAGTAPVPAATPAKAAAGRGSRGDHHE